MSRLPLFVLIIVVRCAPAADSDTYERLAEFSRPGTQPLAPLVEAPDGNFYGAAVTGGAHGFGTVFRVTPAGGVTTLVSFTGREGSAPGSAPDAGLAIGADGALYGVTSSGGTGDFGTAFKVTTAGEFTRLISFPGGAGGSVPRALVQHSDGSFYGVTAAGGSGNFGTAFRLTPVGVLTTLAEFTGAGGLRKGAEPHGPLAVQGATLYGMTRSGGAGNFGTIFSLTTSGTFATLAEFTGIAGAKPGSGPAGGLWLNTDGLLYGTTEFGGANDLGTSFKVTTAGAFTSLRSFADVTGSQPVGSLVQGNDGLLYGATAAGGSAGLGTFYKMTTAGTHAVLTHLTGESGAAPGAEPRSGLIAGADGALYGATSAGGTGNFGAIARVTPTGSHTKLAGFSPPLGWSPSGPPIVESDGVVLFPMALGGENGGGTLVRLTSSGAVSVAAALGGTLGGGPAGGLMKTGTDYYGVTASGGLSNRGTAIKFNSSAGASLLAAYTSTGGGAPEGALIAGTDGALYGVCREGGTASRGTLYKITTAGIRTRIISFTGTAGAAKGARPRGPLVLAPNARFYGATESGGAADAGTVFTMSADGVLTTLVEFTATDPRSPLGGLVATADGFIYGTLSAGGGGDAGALIRLDPATNAWTVAASFSAATTGDTPAGALAAGPDGAVYGMTMTGGSGGAGTVWRYTASRGLEALVAFTGGGGGAPGGGGPGGLLMSPDGAIYGVTAAGGAGGGGTAFRLAPGSPYSVWKQTELGDAAAPDLDDPDRDGLFTLLEYGLLLHPATPDASLAPDSAIIESNGNSFLSLLVPRDPARRDITLTVEAAPSLAGPWDPLAVSANGAPFTGPGYVSGDSPDPGFKSVLVRDVVSVRAASQRFIHLRVSH